MKEKEIIDNYRDLPYGKYEEIVRLCEDEMTYLDRKVAVISVLTGKTEEEVLHLPLETFTRYSVFYRFPQHIMRFCIYFVIISIYRYWKLCLCSVNSKK